MNSISSPSRHDSTFSSINCDSYAYDSDEPGQSNTVYWTTGGNTNFESGFDGSTTTLFSTGTIAPGRYKFECNIIDDCGEWAYRNIVIYINRLPTVQAGGLVRHFAFQDIPFSMVWDQSEFFADGDNHWLDVVMVTALPAWL